VLTNFIFSPKKLQMWQGLYGRQSRCRLLATGNAGESRNPEKHDFCAAKSHPKNATLTEVLQKPLLYSQYSANRRQYQYRYNA